LGAKGGHTSLKGKTFSQKKGRLEIVYSAAMKRSKPWEGKTQLEVQEKGRTNNKNINNNGERIETWTGKH